VIGIITDSMCDIPEDLLEKYSVIVIPQMVIWGEKQLRDRIDLQPVEFYQRITTDPLRPHSSLPAMQDIQYAFQTAIDRGATELVVLTVSSAMSGTYGLVQSAAASLNIPVSMGGCEGTDAEPGLAGAGSGACPRAGNGYGLDIGGVEQCAGAAGVAGGHDFAGIPAKGWADWWSG